MIEKANSSFRDPAGYIGFDDGVLKRVIAGPGAAQYERLIGSGLYSELVDAGLLIEHREERRSPSWPDGSVHVIVPRRLRFISYPYEWSFHQLRDAALLTLELQDRALRRGLSLKDASAYNVQFEGARPVFIDTLSFEPDPGRPWIAYAQFCRQFLGPLLLMQYRSADFGSLLRAQLDGFDLSWASAMLPWRTYWRFGVLAHIHLHARFQQRGRGDGVHAGRKLPPSVHRQDVGTRLALVDSLRRLVERLTGPSPVSTWRRYEQTRPHYSARALASKSSIVRGVLQETQPALVYDLGANTGEYCRLAAARGAHCVALDRDPECVDAMHLAGRDAPTSDPALRTAILPLVMDFTNPSPSLGAAGQERMSFAGRAVADLTLVLGLAHHLRISGAMPFDTLARYMAMFSRKALVEFVPAADSMALQLLGGRAAAQDHTVEGFLAAFQKYFLLLRRLPIEDSSRTLFLFECVR